MLLSWKQLLMAIYDAINGVENGAGQPKDPPSMSIFNLKNRDNKIKTT